MNDTISGLISLLFCLAPFCAGALVIGGVGFLIIRTIRHQRNPLTAGQVNARSDALKSQVRQMAGQLRPWTADSLTDLSTDWDATWSKWGRDLDARGTIPSLSRPKEAAYIAFALHVRGAFEPDGILHACTTQHAFAYRLSQRGVDIRVDDSSLGRIQPDGQLLDVESKIIGEAKRPGGLPALFQIGSAAILRDQRERSYPLILDGKIMGEIANPSIQMLNAIDLKKKNPPAAIQHIETRAEREKLWLLALAILQVAGYNLLESIWTN
ncbi:MAG: hypothetical protein HYZ23_05285 [Chloroflexi bacterium]|nr:hypothetical protein [Chloroflexota bacterium]